MIDRRKEAVWDRIFESLVCRCMTYIDGDVMLTGCDHRDSIDSDMERCPHCGKFIVISDAAHAEALAEGRSAHTGGEE